VGTNACYFVLDDVPVLKKVEHTNFGHILEDEQMVGDEGIEELELKMFDRRLMARDNKLNKKDTN
jgi:hypothetical protein